MQPVANSTTKVIHPGDRTLVWIAAYNFGKGLLLFTVALGLLGFLHRDVDEIVGRWIAALGISLENERVALLLARLDLVTDHQLRVLSAITFLFAAVFIVEGVGLFFKKRWAEYLTVIVTASFIPVELFETIKHFGPAKFILLIVNVAIVSCLLWILKKNAKSKPEGRLAGGLSSSAGHAKMVAMAASAVPALAETKSGPAVGR